MTEYTKRKVSLEDVIYLKKALAFACRLGFVEFEPERLNKIVRILLK